MKALFAPSLSSRPILMAIIVAPPMGNIATMATANVMNGTPILTAPKAAEPTPWPTKIPSMTLYR